MKYVLTATVAALAITIGTLAGPVDAFAKGGGGGKGGGSGHSMSSARISNGSNSSYKMSNSSNSSRSMMKVSSSSKSSSKHYHKHHKKRWHGGSIELDSACSVYFNKYGKIVYDCDDDDD